MRKLDSGQKISASILILLLLLRILHFPLGQWIWRATPPDYIEIPAWYEYSYTVAAYILVSIGIWVNERRLSEMYIDKAFILVFVFVGILISLYYLPVSLGLITAAATFRTIQKLTKGALSFEATPVDFRRVAFLFAAGLAPVLPFYLLKVPLGTAHSQQPESILLAMYYASPPQVVIEEVIYRGMSWMVLRAIGLNDLAIFFVQAALFWASHFNYWSRPFVFWFWAPWISLWLGILAWRSRSITPSALAHFLFNLLAELMRY